jgi:hypothetical protein
LVDIVSKGVTLRPNGTYQVQIWYLGQSRYVGCYSMQVQAASANRIADQALLKSTIKYIKPAKVNNSVLMKRVREMIDANCDGVETRLQRTDVLACNLPHQGDIIVKNFIEPRATQDHMAFKMIAGNCKGIETRLRRTSVSACDLTHQGDISCKGVETNNSSVILKCITCAGILTSDNVSRTQLILK